MMTFVVGLLVVGACATMWRMGGSDKYDSLWRGFGVPVVMIIGKLILTGNWWCLAFYPVGWVCTRLSYGLNDPNHKFWVKVFGGGADGSFVRVEVATRLTCGFVWALSGVVFALVTGGWFYLLLWLPFFTIVNGLVGGLVEDVEMSERVVGGCFGLGVFV